MKIISASNEEK